MMSDQEPRPADPVAQEEVVKPSQTSHDDEWPDEDNQGSSEFARLLAETTGKSLAVEGDVVKGRVVAVQGHEVLIDIGYKSEGVVDIREFQNADGTVSAAPGDEVDVLFERKENQDGYAVLST